jgi:hypothetical protein
MEKVLVAIVLIFSAALSQAATADKNEINCDYTVATSLTTSNPPGKQPSEVSNKITLVKEKDVYVGLINIDDTMQVAVEATIANELMIKVKVNQNKNQRKEVLASAAGLFAPDAGGNFAGKVIVRSAAVETLAAQDEVNFEQALLEKLPLGNNFLGTLVSCH